MLGLTNGESSSSHRDEIDYGFGEVEEFGLEEEMIIDQHSERSSRTPFDDDSLAMDADYVEEATESFDENDEDEYDQIVTRGRSKRQTTKSKKEKKEKPKKSPTTRQNRTTRSASVRF